MKCDDCKFKSSYVTGDDEYPPMTGFSICTKGHWEGGDEMSQPEEGVFDYWEDCKDFKNESKTKN